MLHEIEFWSWVLGGAGEENQRQLLSLVVMILTYMMAYKITEHVESI